MRDTLNSQIKELRCSTLIEGIYESNNFYMEKPAVTHHERQLCWTKQRFDCGDLITMYLFTPFRATEMVTLLEILIIFHYSH